MFTLAGIDDFGSINLKVSPEEGVELRERYAAVQPGYHMNKKHWVTVLVDGTIPDKLIRSWIEQSYNLVVAGLTKKDRLALEGME